MAKAAKRRIEIERNVLEVQNPLWSRDHYGDRTNPRYIEVAASPRESSITAMKIRGILDDAQARSALRFCRLWETLGGKGASAIDYSKEHVDGGRIAEPINVGQMEAGRELKRCRLLLGERGYRLVSLVCGEGYQVSELVSGKRAQLSLMDALRGFLDDLAVQWRYAHIRQPQRLDVHK